MACLIPLLAASSDTSNHILLLAANLVNQAKHRQKQRVSGSTANYVGAYVEIMHSDDFCSVIKISVRWDPLSSVLITTP